MLGAVAIAAEPFAALNIRTFLGKIAASELRQLLLSIWIRPATTCYIEQRVRSLPVARIEDLAEALLDFQNAADLTNWIENANSKEGQSYLIPKKPNQTRVSVKGKIPPHLGAKIVTILKDTSHN